MRLNEMKLTERCEIHNGTGKKLMCTVKSE